MYTDRRKLQNLSQQTRLGILCVYLGSILVYSRLTIGSWLPPSTVEGMWFHSAAFSILFGSLLTAPYFTKPADSLTSATAAVIVLLTAGSEVQAAKAPTQTLWGIALALETLIIASALLAIAYRNLRNSPNEKLADTAYSVCTLLGTTQLIFSVVFFFSIWAFHSGSSAETVSLTLFGTIIIWARPLERLAVVGRQLLTIWQGEKKIRQIGSVVGHEYPRVLRVECNVVRPPDFGDIILAQSSTGLMEYAIVLDHLGHAEAAWFRALESGVTAEWTDTTSDSVWLPPANTVPEAVVTLSERLRKLGVGLVAPGTCNAKLEFEIVRVDREIKQGSLLQVQVGRQTALYQVLDGITCEEMLQQKSTRGFVKASARKIGEWSSEERRFAQVPWLPDPNAVVLAVDVTVTPVTPGAVGRFPGTRHTVSLNVQSLVTHNTAILGILGVGKTYLALELVERIAGAGVRVVCLDMTNQYADALQHLFDRDEAIRRLAQLKATGPAGKTVVSRNVEEGGSVRQFRAGLQTYFTEFLASTDKVNILNPAEFEVWRQDSRPFNDQASMASLTACEVTRMITESILEILQATGMTSEARCCLVYEEAHSLIPEWNSASTEGDRTATNGTAKAILQGRKFGLGCLVVTQRTANVTKTILNQCNTVFALRVFDATGTEFLGQFIGSDYAGTLNTLEDRHAILFGRASSCRDPILIRLNDRDAFTTAFRGAKY